MNHPKSMFQLSGVHYTVKAHGLLFGRAGGCREEVKRKEDPPVG